MSARQVIIPLCIDGHFYFTEESMKPKYAIVRVDDNMFCPAHFEKINNDFVCNYKAKCYDGYGQQLKSPLGCEKCKYGDTKEQLENKIEQVIKRINNIIDILCFTIYMLVSFYTMAWHITWIIFIIDGLLNEIVKLIFEVRGENNEK